MLNFLDGAGYSNAQGADAGPRLSQTFTNVSTASYERGPVIPGGWGDREVGVRLRSGNFRCVGAFRQ